MMTALHMACRDNNHQMAKCLLDLGANCAITDKINKWPDFYTSNDNVLDVFEKHFPVCTHGRGKGKGSVTNKASLIRSTDTNTSAVKIKAYKTGPVETINREADPKTESAPSQTINDFKNNWKGIYDKMEHYNAEGGMDTADLNRRDPNGIYDKIEHYDQDREMERLDLEQREAKKLKLNHKIDFSEDHKKKMKLSVWDRLLTQPKSDPKAASSEGGPSKVTNSGGNDTKVKIGGNARFIKNVVNAKADAKTWHDKGVKK